ncbi:hypothetical protein [Spirosoma fluviale]|uniref:Uncharacterized protein n=1 Tax=Spirosoma fluviale TaxID=1597977 RepID=A0A286GM61_9BACT|nr:hypothetical protein [Spirosoma fluviale]SOD96582.1 hypothetical protein SAMN06269250_5378 [Spirosoma fluviale]
MKLLGICLLFLSLLGRCSPDKSALAEPLSTDGLIIRTGTSFGMCVGYCKHDYVISGTTLMLTQTSQLRTPNQNPVKTCQTTISPAVWDTLKAAANPTLFFQQPEQLGCPDCADGGAEYIELEADGQNHRVIFEHGKTIPGFETLVTGLRAQREALKECK